MREAETKLSPLGHPIVEELVFRKPAPPDETKVTAALARLHAELEPWNARLVGGPFLLGDAFTLADITLYTPLASLVGLLQERAESPALPHLNAWRARIAARPSTAY
jgi:glutathione S-transferase